MRRSAELTLKPLGSSPQEGTSPYTTYTESTYLREGLVLRIQEKGGSVTYTGRGGGTLIYKEKRQQDKK